MLSLACRLSAEPANDTTGKLMTAFGEFTPAGSHWTVRILSEDRKLHVIRNSGHATSDTIPEGWKAGKGWFAYVENDERVWAYDGDKNLFLLVQLGDLGEAIHGACDLPCPVPDEVLARLTADERQLIKEHKVNDK